MEVSNVGPGELVTTAARSSTRRWTSHWLNGKLITGMVLLSCVILFGVVGPLYWDPHLTHVASSPTNLPPMWVQQGYEKVGTTAHPLGTESNGRDILAVMMVSAPASLQVGFIAAGIGILVAIILGSLAGYLGGPFDDLTRTLADAWIVIPPLAVLAVLSSLVRVVDLAMMAFLISLFTWPGPT